jgi:hypothetical protein
MAGQSQASADLGTRDAAVRALSPRLPAVLTSCPAAFASSPAAFTSSRHVRQVPRRVVNGKHEGCYHDTGASR